MKLSEKEKEILETFEKVFPYLTEREKDKLLSIGQGMALKTERIENERKEGYEILLQ